MSISAEDFRTLVNDRMPEAVFQARVLDEAERNHWWAFFVPRNVSRCSHCGSHSFRWTNPGWPDLVLLRLDGPGIRLLVRELKAKRGRVSDAQGIVLEALRRCGIDAKVWRPSDWDEIERTLRGEDATEIALERTDAPDGAQGG